MKYLTLLLTLMLSACASLHTNETGNTLTITAPTVFIPSTTYDWSHFRYEILSTKAKYITVLWEGRGGWFLVGDPVRRAIRQAELEGKIITFKIIGPALSLHAYMACEASKIEYTQNGVLMFHVAADAVTGQIILDDNPELNDMISVCYNKGLLSMVDIHNLKSIHEIWIYPNGVRKVLPDRRAK